MRTAEEERRSDRMLAWLATLVGSVVVVCVIGSFSAPVAIPRFDAKVRTDELVAELFSPPPPAAPVAAPSEPVAEAAAPVVAPAIPDIVPLTETLAPLIAPVMPGVAALRPFDGAPTRPSVAPVIFTPTAAGIFPGPPYPRWARQQGMQGKLQLLVEVSPSGGIADIKVRETSGHDLLDRHVLDWVRANWSWAPGPRRLYLIPFVFELQ